MNSSSINPDRHTPATRSLSARRSRFIVFATLAALACPLTSAEANETPPTISVANFSDHRLQLQWSGPDNYKVFNIRYAQGVLGTSFDRQVQTAGGTGGQLAIRPDNAGTWVFIVEGCNPGLLRSDCSKWSAQASIVAPNEPAPQTKTLTWPAMTAGDCHMQNAKVTIDSYGDATFSAQVKTDHTHSGDVWHATITALNASKQPMFSEKTFDSMTMSDNHGWYDWTQSFGFSDNLFNSIASWDMKKSC